VDVDYYIPGCPPESHQIAAVIDAVIAVLEGKAELPPKGTMLGVGESTVCDECGRKRDVKKIKEFKRIQMMEKIDPEICLLEQGILCNGPATASGCEAKCPTAGAPCIGCYGPAQGVEDYGARLITALASVIDSRDPEEIDKILDGIVDPAGTFYRFNLAQSMMKTGQAAWKEN
jgi:F420-non-reducing hydrogenase small subunit